MIFHKMSIFSLPPLTPIHPQLASCACLCPTFFISISYKTQQTQISAQLGWFDKNWNWFVIFSKAEWYFSIILASFDDSFSNGDPPTPFKASSLLHLTTCGPASTPVKSPLKRTRTHPLLCQLTHSCHCTCVLWPCWASWGLPNPPNTHTHKCHAHTKHVNIKAMHRSALAHTLDFHAIHGSATASEHSPVIGVKLSLTAFNVIMETEWLH